eukprot:TRINITY_DN175_c0_g1_i1.p1 TRINITY_DN175_c0_g1~~TRINITY_DN175_c0_g1_i1.p1  ORF type:complete len:594 (+),score=127.51 TRINITY_DN175_c0_g1_i1:323-2104(+)
MSTAATNNVPGITPHGGTLVDLLVPESQIYELKQNAVYYPSLTLTHRQLCDLELILNGGFSPLTQFMDKATYHSVVENMTLPHSDLLWPMPINLDVTKAKLDSLGLDPAAASWDKYIALRDEEHNLIAVMRVTEIYHPDREREAQAVLGTTNRLHPAVDFLIGHSGEFYIAGPLTGAQLPVHYDYTDIRRTPRQLRQIFHERGWTKIVAFQTRNPMHRAHRELTVRAAGVVEDGVPLKLLVHPVVGETKPGDVDYHTRVKCYKEIFKTYPEGIALLSLNPLAMRMGGPREALWHAILRKNFGCTHFIVGRDHAGPGDDQHGRPFYDPYAAQELAIAKQKELGVKILPFQMMVYLENKKIYCPTDEVPPGEPVANISGTKLRHLLRTGGEIPEWFTYPEVAKILRETYPPRDRQGFTVFFTGLSGSGKSTIANALNISLLEEGSRPVTLLDGDIVRTHLSSELGFSKEHRDINVKRIGYVASEITKARGIAICAPIGPYAETRKAVRQMIEGYGMGGFIEVYVSTPLEVCEKRDKKGLYVKARSGQLRGFTGIDDPYEAPEKPEITIDTSQFSVRQSLDLVLGFLKKEGYVVGK